MSNYCVTGVKGRTMNSNGGIVTEMRVKGREPAKKRVGGEKKANKTTKSRGA